MGLVGALALEKRESKGESKAFNRSYPVPQRFPFPPFRGLTFSPPGMPRDVRGTWSYLVGFHLHHFIKRKIHTSKIMIIIKHEHPSSYLHNTLPRSIDANRLMVHLWMIRVSYAYGVTRKET